MRSSDAFGICGQYLLSLFEVLVVSVSFGDSCMHYYVYTGLEKAGRITVILFSFFSSMNNSISGN